jgi:hypothetical protein
MKTYFKYHGQPEPKKVVHSSRGNEGFWKVLILRLSVALIALGLSLWLLTNMIFYQKPGLIAVTQDFGNVRVYKTPGWHYKVPFSTVEFWPTTYTMEATAMFRDGARCRYTVRYKINDDVDFKALVMEYRTSKQFQEHVESKFNFISKVRAAGEKVGQYMSVIADSKAVFHDLNKGLEILSSDYTLDRVTQELLDQKRFAQRLRIEAEIVASQQKTEDNPKQTEQE